VSTSETTTRSTRPRSDAPGDARPSKRPKTSSKPPPGTNGRGRPLADVRAEAAAGAARRTRTWLRAIFVTLATLLVLALGLLYPALARQEAWRTAKWLDWAWLALLPIVPFVVARMTLGADARVPRLALPTVLPLARGPRGWRARLRDVPGILRGAALVLAILALARPQNVLRGEDEEERGIDIFLVLDLSGSMKALMDAADSPTPVPGRPARRLTRLETAKEVILDFVSKRKTDRIGVVVFGKSAYILSPPTLDKTLLRQLVTAMDLDIIDGTRTAIGDAVGTAVARLRRSNARSKAVILLTDGDSNAGAIAPEYAAHLAQTQGVRVYTVQIGNGDEVDVQQGFDIFGQPRFVRDHYPVNPELLKKMASETGGDAFVATDKRGLEQSMHDILDKLEKTRFEAQAATMEDLFPFFLVSAVVLVALEALVRLLLVRRFP
jgi:Ca-activated chloride channel family protein